MTNSFELDLAGGAEVLKEMAAATISEIALQVAAATDEGATVDEYAQVDDKVTDRFVAMVSVPAERQAKDGVLTRAAAAAGLEVTVRPVRERKSRSRKPSRKGASGDVAGGS